MCIRNDGEKVVKLRQQMTVLQLWKVVNRDDSIGIWADTRKSFCKFRKGENVAIDYISHRDCLTQPGAFHCCFTRKAARCYRVYRSGNYNSVHSKLKVVKVFARTADIVSAGRDKYVDVDSISVSKMEIKSLKHQR